MIEFMGARNNSEDIYTFELPEWRENLFVIFGTTSVLDMLLPNLNKLPITGLEWTYMNMEG